MTMFEKVINELFEWNRKQRRNYKKEKSILKSRLDQIIKVRIALYILKSSNLILAQNIQFKFKLKYQNNANNIQIVLTVKIVNILIQMEIVSKNVKFKIVKRIIHHLCVGCAINHCVIVQTFNLVENRKYRQNILKRSVNLGINFTNIKNDFIQLLNISGFPLQRDLNNFIIKYYIFIPLFWGLYKKRQCYKIVINELLEKKGIYQKRKNINLIKNKNIYKPQIILRVQYMERILFAICFVIGMIVFAEVQSPKIKSLVRFQQNTDGNVSKVTSNIQILGDCLANQTNQIYMYVAQCATTLDSPKTQKCIETKIKENLNQGWNIFVNVHSFSNPASAFYYDVSNYGCTIKLNNYGKMNYDYVFTLINRSNSTTYAPNGCFPDMNQNVQEFIQLCQNSDVYSTAQCMSTKFFTNSSSKMNVMVNSFSAPTQAQSQVSMNKNTRCNQMQYGQKNYYYEYWNA